MVDSNFHYRSITMEVSFQSANDQRKKIEEMTWSISKTNETVSNWGEKYGCKWRNKTWLFQRLVAGKSFETLEQMKEHVHNFMSCLKNFQCGPPETIVPSQPYV